MPTCFVIQPFDKSTFDKRYADVFEPAISEAGLEAYRVDRDPAVSIPIREIEDGIRAADVCFAEITTDNPNVWFELGYAIALNKDVVLVCSNERKSRFPFDIQHRSIVTYTTESSSDFTELKTAIVERIKAILSKRKSLDALATSPILTTTEGLSGHEIVALVSVAVGAEVPGGPASAYRVKQDGERAGYTEIAVTIALRSLVRRGYIEPGFDTDDRSGEQYPTFSVTDKGLDWLEVNQARLVLRKPTKRTKADDVPF